MDSWLDSSNDVVRSFLIVDAKRWNLSERILNVCSCQEHTPYVVSHNTFMHRWEIWRGSLLVGVHAYQHYAEDICQLLNEKLNEGEEK